MCVSLDLNSGKLEFFIFGGGGCSVSSDLDSGKKVRVFYFPGGRGVLRKLRSELRKEG